MNATEFVQMFIEYLHEYSNDKELIGQLSMFLNYGWGGNEIELIEMLIENGASIEAVKAVVNAFEL